MTKPFRFDVLASLTACCALSACTSVVVEETTMSSSSTAATGGSGGNGGTGGVAGCAAPLSACGGQCVDTSSDPQNCGTCGHACAGTCTASVCEAAQIACGGTVGPGALALDADRIYVTNKAEGTVWSAPKAGGSVTILVSGQKNPWPVVVDATHVYWGNFGASGVERTTKDGGPAEKLAQLGSAAGLAVDDAYLYVGQNVSLGPISRVPKEGGAPTELVKPQTGVSLMVLSSGYLFWTGGDAIGKVATDGSSAAILGQLQTPTALAADASSVYVANLDGSVVRIPVAGGPAEAVVPQTSLGTVAGLLVDATRLYAVSHDGGKLYGIPLGGGEPALMASTPAGFEINSTTAIAGDAEHVYWVAASHTQSCVFRTAK